MPASKHPFKVVEGAPSERAKNAETRAKRNAEIQKEREKVLMTADWAHQRYTDGKKQDAIGGGSNVTRALEEARTNGIVAFNIDASFGFRGREDGTRIRRIRESFVLDRAIVVACDLREPEPGDLEDERREDEHLHVVLANHAGEHFATAIKEGRQIQAGVALSGGRATYQFARRFGRRPPQVRYRDELPLMAISGTMWAHRFQFDGPTLRRPVDADDAARIMAQAFEDQTPTSLNRVDHQLLTDTPAEAKRFMDDHCPFLSDGTWRDSQKPSLAIVGVGCIDPLSGHRFSDLHRDTKALAAPGLERTAKEVDAINRFALVNGLPFPGDVAHRLYAVVPLPRDVKRPQELDAMHGAYAELRKLLKGLNDRMVVVNWSHLADMSLLAIGGGRYKKSALWTLLLARLMGPDYKTSWPSPSEVCTDGESADVLVDSIESLKSNRPLYEAYGRLLRSIAGMKGT